MLYAVLRVNDVAVGVVLRRGDVLGVRHADGNLPGWHQSQFDNLPCAV